jgi:CxC2 like cysteine cluster associated with KDZ transposases
MDNPLHRITVWTGSYFRPAQLWEAGVYLLVPHYEGEAHCTSLKFHKQNLDRFQTAQDDAEGAALADAQPRVVERAMPVFWDNHMEVEDLEDGSKVPTLESEMLNDAEVGRRLDMLYQGQVEGMEGNGGHSGNRSNSDDLEHVEEEDETEMEEDDDGLTLPDHYMVNPLDRAQEDNNADKTVPSHTTPTNVPHADSLKNPYVRVVHTNGIHHIALVYCGCHGTENTHSDLMAARLVPASFTRYRTLFTHAVLDDFRLANLECKTSAYQYFQKLRRLTSPMAPETAPNLYHELRRMSRVWRWMKKLKWAGFGHNTTDVQEPAAGELANFCPACPQPEINLPEKWEQDSQRWVYRRFFVADGNFKADHVRQHGPTPDIWLSPGGGMMSKDEEYKDFLKTAFDMATVGGRSCR